MSPDLIGTLKVIKSPDASQSDLGSSASAIGITALILPPRARTASPGGKQLVVRRALKSSRKQQAASNKLDSYSMKDYIGYYESKRSKKNN